MSLYRRLITALQFLFRPGLKRAMGEIERLKRLVHMVNDSAEDEIACDEAYRLLDRYADALLRGEDAPALLPRVKKHLEMCMDCREELEALLAALRALRAPRAPAD